MKNSTGNSTKNAFRFLLPLIFAAAVIYSFTINDTKPGTKNVQDDSRISLAFITYNDYGNNLFIDNITAGKRDTLDLAVISINNVPKDTTYNNDSSSAVTFYPSVSVINAGKQSFGAFKVTISVNGVYSSKDSSVGIPSGSILQLTGFSQLILSTGTPNFITVFISSDSQDDNRNNDTLYQTSIIYPGIKRKVLLEEWTSNTCSACAVNNPAFDTYVNSKIDSIISIRYHVGFPSPGNDSMYTSDSAQINQRLNYYGVNSVPEVILDGENILAQPYNGGNMDDPIAQRKLSGSPVSISVTDTRIAGDSISSQIILNVFSPISSGNYKMRVNAIERKKTYSTAPGTNGETVFYDIFRHAYPDINGISVNRSPGVYSYNIKYKRDASWVDSNLYTAVYIQNDDTKEILNTAKARNVVLDKPVFSLVKNTPVVLSGKNVCISDRPVSPGNRRTVFNSERFSTAPTYSFELFENSFPPPGWKIENPNGDITFTSATGPNGIVYAGSKSAYMDFYDYNTIGRRDTLISKTFYKVNQVDSISFDYSHAQYQNENDSLIVLASVNGGLTWPFRIFAKGGSSLITAGSSTSPFFPTSATQWRTFTVSLNGIVGIHNISTEIPSGYELKQNYPNPFNPTTNISFSIPKSSLVKIRIYDVTGRVIDEILNETLNTGSYNYTWQGSNFASGVYYYAIEAGDFRETKKMVLLK